MSFFQIIYFIFSSHFSDHPTPSVEPTEDASPSVSPSKSRKFKLQRSESDRVPFKPGNEQSNSFKDTMRIKSMRKHYNKEMVDKLLLRPREPPPPPPKTQSEKSEKTTAQGTKGVGTEIVKDKILRAKILNSHGGVLEEHYENVNAPGLPKTIHLKLAKTIADYEGIKLFNKYELPSIPEEQKLSPVLNKKETGPKFVVNDAQSALLKEINDKLKKMEEKRVEKEEENNVYEDIVVEEKIDKLEEKRPEDKTRKDRTSQGDGKSSGSNESPDVDKELRQDEPTIERDTVDIDDHIYDSPEAGPYETIKLILNKTDSECKKDQINKELEIENKTEHETSNTTENSQCIDRLNIESDVNKDVNKTVDEMCLPVSKDNPHITEARNTAKLDAPKSPFSNNGAFLPKETSTPIYSRTKSENTPVSKASEDKINLPKEENSRRVSVVSTEDNAAISIAGNAEPAYASTLASRSTVKPVEDKVLSTETSKFMVIPPKKSSGKFIQKPNREINLFSIILRRKYMRIAS